MCRAPCRRQVPHRATSPPFPCFFLIASAREGRDMESRCFVDRGETIAMSPWNPPREKSCSRCSWRILSLLQFDNPRDASGSPDDRFFMKRLINDFFFFSCYRTHTYSVKERHENCFRTFRLARSVLISRVLDNWFKAKARRWQSERKVTPTPCIVSKKESISRPLLSLAYQKSRIFVCTNICNFSNIYASIKCSVSFSRFAASMRKR